jgi:CBS domain-containing protein
MKVEEVMSVDLETCRPEDTLNRAAQIMWEHDCGVVPVVDAESRVVGMVTDRDICMAAYTQGRSLSEISVSNACSRDVRTCELSDTVEMAESIMREAQIRRIPVVDAERKLYGIVSLADLAQCLEIPGRKVDGLSYQSVASTLAAISQPSSDRSSIVPTRPQPTSRPQAGAH